MVHEPLYCPYCNASVPVPSGAVAGQRLFCPRCGDSFVWRAPGGEAIQASPPSMPAPRPPNAAPAPPSDRRSANRKVALLVVGVMLLMGGVGLAYALWTEQTRRSHDTGLPPELMARRHKRTLGQAVVETTPTPSSSEDNSSRAPERLAALRYLPRGTRMLLAADVVEWQRWRSEKPWLKRPLHIAGHEVPPNDLQAWTGLTSDAIDHLVIGATLPASGKETGRLPAVYLVVRARKTLALSQVLEALHSSIDKGSLRSQKTIYPATLPSPIGPVSLWFADGRTLVFNLFGDDELKKVPFTPQSGLDHLDSDVRSALVDRLRGPSPLWAIAHMEAAPRPEEIDKLPGLRLPGGLGEQWKKLDTVAVWLQGDRPETDAVIGLGLGCTGWAAVHGERDGRLLLRAAVRAVDTMAAKDLLTRLGRPSFKDAGLRAERDDRWLSIAWSADRATVEKALAK